MDVSNHIKSLYIIVNAGFTSDVIELARKAGAKGATIINARGESTHPEMFMGITVDSEKEIILCIVEESISDSVMAVIKEKAGYNSPAHSVCFTMPVEKMIGINMPEPQTKE